MPWADDGASDTRVKKEERADAVEQMEEVNESDHLRRLFNDHPRSRRMPSLTLVSSRRPFLDSASFRSIAIFKRFRNAEIERFPLISPCAFCLRSSPLCERDASRATQGCAEPSFSTSCCRVGFSKFGVYLEAIAQ